MSLNISNLDFDSVKQNLLDFLRTQDEFSDFDFTGSAMNVLIDVMAYSIHYSGVQSNFSLNEMFLDTAILRNSVISRAKELNYMPGQYSASSSNITMSITPVDSPVSIVIPKNTKFQGIIDRKLYSFVNDVDVILYENAGTYSASFNVNEGRYITESFVYDSTSIDQIYKIKNEQVDVTKLEIQVGDEFWTNGNNQVIGNVADTYYYTSEEKDRHVGVYFGDGAISQKPADGTNITISYFVTKGEEADGINSLQLISNVAGYPKGQYTVEVNTRSYGGGGLESIESIKINAPKMFATQNRAVTVDDYKAIILNKYPEVQTVNVWGGEDANPAVYGMVYICVRPVATENLSVSVKKQIISDLKSKYGVITIDHEIVDPEYLYVELDIATQYNIESSIHSSRNLTSLIVDNVKNYFENELINFDSVLYYSNLAAVIDSSDSSILGNVADIAIKKKLHLSSSHEILYTGFNNEILPNSLISDEWTAGNPSKTFQLKDDGLGKIYVYGNGILEYQVGIVDYTLGNVSFTYLSGYEDNTVIYLIASPAKKDLSILYNNLVSLSKVEVVLNG